MKIDYEGPVRGLHMLAGDLRKAGYEVEFEQPEEQRGMEQDVVAAVIGVVIGKGSDAAIAGAKHIVEAFREHHRGVKAELSDVGDPRGYL